MYREYLILVVAVCAVIVHQTQAAAVAEIGERSPRVVNGSPANQDITVAHHVLITYMHPNRTGYHGGGSIISSNAVLTSARNIAGFSVWKLGMGSTDLYNLTYVESTNAVTHPLYNALTRAHDIGIILLSPRLQFSLPTIQPIRIPTISTGLPRANEQLRIIGFGSSNYDSVGIRSDRLLNGYQRVAPANTCQTRMSTLYNSPFTFCGIESPLEYFAGNNICNGEFGSGATLQILMTNTLVGIVTDVPFDCDETTPALYTNVSPYRGWIAEIVGRLEV